MPIADLVPGTARSPGKNETADSTVNGIRRSRAWLGEILEAGNGHIVGRSRFHGGRFLWERRIRWIRNGRKRRRWRALGGRAAWERRCRLQHFGWFGFLLHWLKVIPPRRIHISVRGFAGGKDHAGSKNNGDRNNAKRAGHGGGLGERSRVRQLRSPSVISVAVRLRNGRNKYRADRQRQEQPLGDRFRARRFSGRAPLRSAWGVRVGPCICK